ncbi:hypothetical protein PR048_008556 [Dryococelus australis]|uniref:Uncharacterized protein n=1 Tax=Dryococelus australis TaxID=614101 RepID=A0ABQ9HXF1_9NEOP|nr:hypothetical protein PR048_008556 [Dryococelus australis]
MKILIASLLQKHSWMKITSAFKKKKCRTIFRHFEALKKSFQYYFPTAEEEVIDHFGWVQNVLPDFWWYLLDEFKILSEKEKLVLLPFLTKYLCKAGFSTHMATKTKYRSRLNGEPDISCN